MTAREVVAEAGDVALVHLADDDLDRLNAADDGAFDVDDDDRPPLYEPDVHRLGVVRDGELLGTVSWHATGYGRTFGCTAWNVGIGLLPAGRGRGLGALSLRLLAEYLFATTEVDRIEAGTDVENLPAQRALARSGMRREGIVRGAQVRGGGRRDMVTFGLLRADLVRPEPGAARKIVAARDGVALAEPVPGEKEAFLADAAGDFEIDRDDRPRLTQPPPSAMLSVLDEQTGALLGGLSWHPVDYGGTLGCSAWNIGIGLLPSARGRGVGTTAQRLLAEHLFATTELDRVEAGTDVENVAEQRALQKAGFRREGVLRGTQVRGGTRHDLVHYGILRSDLDPPGERAVILEADGLVLAESWPAERREVYSVGGPFDADPDPRPVPGNPPESHHAAILEAGSGRLLGILNWHVVSYGSAQSCAAWNIGIVLVPEARGRGVGSTAQRLLAAHLFATTELDRVEAGTDVANIAERRALEKAGFREDGVLRGAHLRGGRRADMVSYARLRTDQ